MPAIYRYRQVSDDYATYRPLGDGLIELCTLPDGYTYISIPDDAKLADEQPKQVKLEEFSLTDELKEQIKAASPLVQLIYQRIEDKIHEKFDEQDELFFSRIGVAAALGRYQITESELQEIDDYQSYAEACREWGRLERAKLGL